MLLPLFASMLVATAAADGPLDVEGIWYTEGDRSQVEITRQGDSVVGTIIWYSGYDDEVVFDTQNPDEAEHGKEILGLEILNGFQKGGKRWRKGQIYDPTNGKSYRSAISLKDTNTLEVQGCVSVMCRSLEWQRVPQAEIMRVGRAPVGREAD